MLKDLYAKYYFDQNYNCAESVLRAGNEYYNLKLHDRDMILVGGFGGGMQCGSTCGAVLAAVSILSMKYVEAKAHESEDIKPVVNILLDQFKAKYGSLLCDEIKPQSFQPECRCQMTVETACDFIEQVIAEYDSNLEKQKKASILESPLSEDELEKVAGGVTYFDLSQCSGEFYNEACSDTVETGSHCWSGDASCKGTGREYTCTANIGKRRDNQPYECKCDSL